jgi:hypothetical protein
MSGVIVVLDTRDLLDRVDLLALIGSETQLHRVAATGGGEYAGPCPFCGGTDRLRVQPVQRRWWCRQCSPDERWEDAIAFVRRRDGCTFPEACTRLGAATPLGPPRRATKVIVPTPAPPTVTPPPARWQAAAAQVVAEAEAALWDPGGSHARTYHSDRGIAADTARAWRLGYNARDRTIAGLWVPAGLVIPWEYDGGVCHLKLRRRQPTDSQRYTSVAGGRPIVYGAHTLTGHDVALLCEGELDAVLAHQEASDLVGVFTLGSASAPLPAQAIPHLLPLRRILVAYDADRAGEQGAAKLGAVSRRCVRITPPVGKDIGDFWRSGGNVRSWIAAEIGLLQLPERQPVVPQPHRCDAAGCDLALAEPRDEVSGGWCLRHLGHLQLVTFAEVMDWPRLETGAGVIEGPGGWLAFARHADSAAVARIAGHLGALP